VLIEFSHAANSTRRKREQQQALSVLFAREASEVLLDPICAPFTRLDRGRPAAPLDECYSDVKRDPVEQAHATH
jgi:hypothetical protein